MKNKILLLIILILIILMIIITHKPNTKQNSNKISNSNTSSTNHNNEYKANFNGENATIYLGTHSQYETFSIILNKSNSKDEIVTNIISKISDLIGYKIVINNVSFQDKNIYIDLSNEFAPFDLEKSFIDTDEEKKFSIYGNDNIIYSIFDSIYKSLIAYFGDEYNIYFNSNSENINITIDDFKFEIDASTPYILEE